MFQRTRQPLRMSAGLLIALTAMAACAPTSGPQERGNSALSEHLGADTMVNAAAQPILTITGTDGAPVAGASVLVGSALHQPFQNNFAKTDSAGQLTIPAAWTSALPVTVDAPGYVRATFYGIEPASVTLELHRAALSTPVVLKGQMTGFGALPRDGFLDIGVVFPALTRGEASVAEVSNLISKDTDAMSVFGQTFQVPSNMTFPTQTETYIFPIKFDKPDFRFSAPESRTWKIAATHVRFPAKKVIDQLRAGNSFFDLINELEFRETSVNDVNLAADTSAVFAVNTLKLEPAYGVTAPDYLPPYSMLSVALSESDGLYLVSDVKRVDAKGQAQLAAPHGASKGLIVSLLRRPPSTGPGNDELSSITQDAGINNAVSNFLPVPRSPQVGTSTLVLDPPSVSSANGLIPVATYAVLYRVETSKLGNDQVENKKPQWELYSGAWDGSLALPQFPNTLPSFDRSERNVAAANTVSQRWSVLFGGRKATSALPHASGVVGPKSLNGIDHATRSAVDF
jgi:hypothetical protein